MSKRVKVIKLLSNDSGTGIELGAEGTVERISIYKNVHHVKLDKPPVSGLNLNDDGTYQMYPCQLKIIGDEKVDVFINFAKQLATLSKCKERHVAAIILDKDMMQIYSIGINGGPKGVHNCMCVTEGKYGCIHAEINALIKCTSTDLDKVMIVTLAPCKQCAAAIINAPGGFSTVYILEDWKDKSGVDLLERSGIEVIRRL